MAERAARWIRMGVREPRALRAAAARLAALQRADAAPMLLWACDDGAYPFVLVAPRRDAPGRPARWIAWVIAPMIASYRHFGLRAYRDGRSLCLDGRPIAVATAAEIGACAVVDSRFERRFALADAKKRSTPEFRAWLRESLALAPSEWTTEDALPAERTLEAVFRARLEAQYGWHFEHDWPSAEEAAAIRELSPGSRVPLPVA